MENSGVFTRHFWAGWSVDSSLWRCARDVKLGGGRGAVPEHDGEIKYPIWPGKPFTQKPLNFSRRNIKKFLGYHLNEAVFHGLGVPPQFQRKS